MHFFGVKHVRVRNRLRYVTSNNFIVFSGTEQRNKKQNGVFVFMNFEVLFLKNFYNPIIKREFVLVNKNMSARLSTFEIIFLWLFWLLLFFAPHIYPKQTSL